MTIMFTEVFLKATSLHALHHTSGTRYQLT